MLTSFHMERKTTMPTKIALAILLLLTTVCAQQYLREVPSSCTVPRTPPRCIYSTPTLNFQTCSIYNGGDCGTFCHRVQAQYWTQSKPLPNCFLKQPSLYLSQRIFSACTYNCTRAKTLISNYRNAGPQTANPIRESNPKSLATGSVLIPTKESHLHTSPSKSFGSSGFRPDIKWSTRNIKVLIYLGVDDRGKLRSQILVYSTNLPILCNKNLKGASSCHGETSAASNSCICSSCWSQSARCPGCCRHAGFFWI